MKPKKRKFRLKFAVYAFLIYSLIGFILVPFLIRYELRTRVAEPIHRSIETQWIFFNPYTFTVSLHQPKVTDENQELLFEADKIKINFQPLALIRKQVVLKKLELQAPKCYLKRDTEGSFNFDDLLPQQEAPNPSAPEARDGDPLVFTVDRLIVSEGQFSFEDAQPHSPFLKRFKDISFSLNDISTELNRSGTFQLDTVSSHAESFNIQGELSLNPLAIKGQVAIDALDLPSFMPYLEGNLRGRIHQGYFSTHMLFEVSLGSKQLDAAIWDTQVQLEDFVLNTLETDAEVFGIDQLQLINLSADLLESEVSFDAINCVAPRIKVHRRSDESINLFDLVNTSAESPPSSNNDADWHWSVDKLDLLNGRIEYLDEAIQEATQLAWTVDHLSVEQLSNHHETPFTLNLESTWPEAGKIALQGNGSLVTRTGNIQIQSHDWQLAPLSPFVGEMLKISAISGSLESNTRLSLLPEQQLDIQSDCTIRRLELQDAEGHKPLLSWNEFKLSGLHYQQSEKRLNIRGIDLLSPQLAFSILEDGSHNLDLLIDPKAEAITASKLPQSDMDKASPLLDHTAIEHIGISGGSITFKDLQQNPAVALQLSDLDGTIQGLSSSTEGFASIDANAKVQGVAPLSIIGKTNPLIPDSFTELEVKLQGLEMTPFAPYFSRYVGYRLEKGVLALDMAYKVRKTILEADNLVQIHQLSLGEKTDSPDATTLPVTLAISLLKDPSGNIDLDLPITGDTSDPDFRYGKAVWKALGNLIIKIGSSPFNILAKLSPFSAEELESIPFESGKSVIAEGALPKLDSLANDLMRKRPGISVEIQAPIDSAVELPALTKLRLTAQLSDKYQGDAQAESNDDPQAPIAQEDYQNWIRKAWRAKHPLSIVDTDPPSFQEMESELLADIQINQADLIALSRARKEAIRAYLINQQEISPDRILIVETSDPETSDLGISMAELKIK